MMRPKLRRVDREDSDREDSKVQKVDRQEFCELAAVGLQIVADKGNGLVWREQLGNCVFYATLILSILDHYRGRRVPTAIPLEDARMTRLFESASGAIGLELLVDHDPRIHSADFWLAAVGRAERVLCGFTKWT